MRKLQIILSILYLLILPLSTAYGDWITEGYFSEQSGIDSLERFLVIQDVIDSTYFGYNITPLGDINNDGLSDILIVRADFLEGQDHNSFLYYGGDPPDGAFEQEFTNFTILVRNIGDINGDGYDDLSQNDGVWKKQYFFYGGPDIDDSADKIIEGVSSVTSKPADIDADGFLDMVLSSDINGGDVFIFKLGDDFDSSPEYIISDTSKDFGRRVNICDYNGDGYADVLISAALNRDSCFVKFYWGGPDFDTIPDFEIYGFDNRLGQYLLPVGDFNGDGYSDIFIGGDSPKRSGIYFGGPDYDDQIDVAVNYYYGDNYNAPDAYDIAGDVNNDGYPDFIYSDLVVLSQIYIYLGGPDADSLIDVNIGDYDMPGMQLHFGVALAGIGDFNGDGIDDFAVRSQNGGGGYWMSEVNLFAGWDNTPTDIDLNSESALPTEFKLSQNYPNPFNLSTMIEFDLPVRSKAELSIYNILGRKISTLLNRELPAGTHKIKWDGLDNEGNPVASGIYFYRLSTDNFAETRKMILSK